MSFADQKPAFNGALARPEFGPIPEPRQDRKPRAPFPYKALIDVVRDHPGMPAAIAVFKKGTKKQTLYQCIYQRDKTKRWLEDNYPLECWAVTWRTTADTWCERKLYVELLGTFATEEDAIAFRKRRRQEWEEGRGRGLMKRADRLAREKLDAINHANRRHRP